MDNSFLESLKTAGASSAEVAKDFGNRFKAERQQQAQQAKAERVARAADVPVAAEGEKSFIDKLTETVRELGETVVSAANETFESESFARARQDVTAAFEEGREGVTEAISNAKEKRATPNKAAETAPQAPLDENIVEGEVVDDDNSNPFGSAS
ncbi:CGLAU_01105 family protein [Corynebacterium striatum]